MSLRQGSTSHAARPGEVHSRPFGLAALVAFPAVVIAVFAATPAMAVTQSPQWTVTAISGPTNFSPAANEVQTIAVDASGGTFTLSFAGQTTSAIPASATSASVQSDLDALSTIGGAGGSVTVTGGPGRAHPYVVTFGGALADRNVEQMTVEDASLTFSVGDTLTCTSGPVEERLGIAISYQWLRTGQPISGAASSTYTTVAVDAGTAIQCVSTVSNLLGLPASVAASAARVISPAPATPVPVPPSSIPEPSGFAAAGETLTCEPGSWSGSPTFTYLWLENGFPIPGATSSTYVVKASDVPSNLQCEVIGTNAGGSVVQISANKETSPPLEPPNVQPRNETSTVPAATVTTTTDGGSTGTYTVEVKNTGGAPSDGSTITVTDILPNGLREASAPASGVEWLSGSSMGCAGLVCTFSGVVIPDDFLLLTIPVEVVPGAPSSVTNTVTVTGGGASEASVDTPTAISSTPAGFGIAPGSLATALSTAQAGAHPDLTVSLAFTTKSKNMLTGDPKEAVTDLPPGFVGDLADAPRCSIVAFSEQNGAFSPQKCPLSAQVGTNTLVLNTAFGAFRLTEPIYNLTTNPGEIAKLGFSALVLGIQGTISLRPGDYGVRTTFQNINDSFTPVEGTSLTVWGVPSDPSHDAMRGLICDTNPGKCEYFTNKPGIAALQGAVGFPLGYPEEDQPQISGQPSTSPAIPYLTSPTDCTGAPLQATFSVASWEQPDQKAPVGSSVGPLTGCNLLEFGPFITAAPDTSRADTPAGFTFDVKVPQEGLVNPEGLSTADIKNTTATLPTGVMINPGQAVGLGACQFSQDGVGVESPPSCPSNSRVGEVEVETPLIKRKLKGQVYLLASNPPDVKLLVAPEDPADGIYVKFIGDVHLNEATGQLITTFEGTPQLPFNELKLSFSGGAQAALATPTGCGTYATTADFAPWSGESDAQTSSNFAIETGPAGSACASPLPFSPSLIAGATTDQAGGFTHFSLLLQRNDGQQRISTLQFKTPPGLLGVINKVPLCSEPGAAKGECPAGSQIGHTVVESGPGPYPLVVPQPSQPAAPIYLTGPYKGAPYGLSIKVPLIVGPFNLGIEVVRSKIEVDPLTSQLTVTTDLLPPIIDGVPTDLRAINAMIDRPEFMFNPTNCSPMSFSGTATSLEGTLAPIASHFQVGSCQTLKFKPGFHVTTSGHTSRSNGASLDVKLTYPKAPWGTQANIRSVKVDLPKQLPSRLTTLQKACPDATFDANPGACPVGSRVGSATAITPILAGSLSGPAYFVSHGGAKFPELIIVLQGDGVTVDLHGETFINKAGITSSTFRQVPDVPVGTFELKLPQGSNSALAANGNLCKSTLRMPTAFTAQNGLVIRQSTPMTATGCSKHVRHERKKNLRKKK